MWYDHAALYLPLAAKGNMLLQHEDGADGNEGSGVVAIPASIESADMDVSDGEDFSFISRLIPDIDFSGSSNDSSVTMAIIPRRAPGKSVGVNSRTSGNAAMAGSTITPYTERVGLRVRARQARLKVSSDEVGVKWRLGVQRLDIQPDGKK
jgi:hypothetical protein